MTTAEEIAEQFGNDGQNYYDNDDEHIVCVCEDQAITEDFEGDITRYEFADGSAIVTAPGGWDIEGSEPFSWAGAH